MVQWLRGELPPLLVGHRGAKAVAPENTMASFRRAWEDGADAVEMDVRLTADGAVVVIHDETVDRTTDGHGAVVEMSLEELRRLDAGSWFDPAYAGERIPTLEEVLAWAQGKVALLIELKYPQRRFRPDLVPAVLARLRGSGMETEVAIISFDGEAIEQVRREAASLPAGVMEPDVFLQPLAAWLARRFPALTGWRVVRRLLLRPLALALRHGATMVLPHSASLSTLLVAEAHRRGMPVSPGGARWDYPAAIAMGVDTIAADNPGEVRRRYLASAAFPPPAGQETG
jgi:glycerophosphoryl diester phosphodiesterase